MLHRRAAEGELQRRRPHEAARRPGRSRSATTSGPRPRPGRATRRRRTWAATTATRPCSPATRPTTPTTTASCGCAPRARSTARSASWSPRCASTRAPVQFPISPFVAGSFATSNNGGKKVIVDGQGQAGQVRCTDVTAPSCVDFSGSQVSNPASVTAGDPNLADTVLDDTTLDALRKTAQQNGTYYSSTTAGKTSCPGDPTGAVVFVEDLSCQYAAVERQHDDQAGHLRDRQRHAEDHRQRRLVRRDLPGEPAEDARASSST